ncbi:MAG TPA: ROK family transcriptional regulator [Solirubrobacteraceae bacterium]|nr:ROK family transcriptional regulator [Solirubrobacteraceae bacterium]
MEPDDPGSIPANQRSVRRHNLGVVLRHIAARGPRSRAAIAQGTGLNKTTVSSLVGELLDAGLVRETEVQMLGTVGRPALPVEMDGRNVIGLGLEIGVDFLAVRAVDLRGEERHRERVEVDNRGRGVAAVLDDLGTLAVGVLGRAEASELLVVGAVVALPGLVDSSGRLLIAPNLGWSGVPVADELVVRFGSPGFPVRVENEANLGALAELWEGAGRRLRDFVYISGELGIGAGIIVGRELFRGTHGFGGELGHTTVDPDGAVCACGNRGCLETRVALGHLLESAGLDADAGVDALAERAQARDPRALEALEQAGHWLGVGVASAANLLNPDGVIVGGYLARLGEWLVPGLEAELADRVLSAEWDVPRVLTSALGAEAAVRGAAASALRRVFDDPAVVAELAGSAHAE